MSSNRQLQVTLHHHRTKLFRCKLHRAFCNIKSYSKITSVDLQQLCKYLFAKRSLCHLWQNGLDLMSTP